MGQVLHRSATTTEAVRRAIQHSQESMRALARRHGINQKTVAKWKKRKRPVWLSITHNSERVSVRFGLKSVTINLGAVLMDFLHGASG